jgi:hypothetical protein
LILRQDTCVVDRAAATCQLKRGVLGFDLLITKVIRRLFPTREE